MNELWTIIHNKMKRVNQSIDIRSSVPRVRTCAKYRYTIECAYARAYTCICACSCICVSLRLFTCINANAVSCVRACLGAELIKTQNAFARKIFQHANALWVQKLSGCTIVLKEFSAAV